MKKILFTKEGYEKFLEEFTALHGKKKQAIEDVKKYREMGDLSENGAYKGAKIQLGTINRRLYGLDNLLRSAQIIEGVVKDTVDIGCSLVVKSNNELRTLSLVGQYETDPLKGKISYTSPLGVAVMGKRIGDIVTVTIPNGRKNYEIIKIVYS